MLDEIRLEALERFDISTAYRMRHFTLDQLVEKLNMVEPKIRAGCPEEEVYRFSKASGMLYHIRLNRWRWTGFGYH